MPSWTNDRRRTLALAAIFVYSLTHGEETEHYKIKQPIRQKSPLLPDTTFQPLSSSLQRLLATHGVLSLETRAQVADKFEYER